MENKRVLVDTSLLIEHFRKKKKENSYLFRISKDYILNLSVISEFEMLVGTKQHQMSDVKKIIEYFDILMYDSKVAEVSASIAIDLKAKNKLIDFKDIFIAATAISNNLILATLNYKHFELIPELKILKTIQ